MATDETDAELDEIQDRVDRIRDRLPDNPGLDVVDKDDVPAEGVSKDEAVRRDDPDDHQAHAPG
tara:strand:+ start:152 stop:343 length:192 start_codon:yes stop_codon:yes gene_type:complete